MAALEQRGNKAIAEGVRVSGRSREGALVHFPFSSRVLGVWQWSSAMVGASSVHGSHAGILSSTWQATK